MEKGSFLKRLGTVLRRPAAAGVLLVTACGSNTENKNRHVPMPCPQVDVAPNSQASLNQYLVFNGLPDRHVKVYDAISSGTYDLASTPVGEHVALPNISAEVVFESGNHITLREICDTPKKLS